MTNKYKNPLSSKNKSTAVNAYEDPTVTYFFGVVHWNHTKL